MGIHFYDMAPQFSNVYFVLSQILNQNLNTLRSLSKYHFNIKTIHICKNMLTKFHEIQGPVIFFQLLCKHMAPIHQNVKNTIIMFQCKTYLNTLLSLNHHASMFIGRSRYVQCFPY